MAKLTAATDGMNPPRSVPEVEKEIVAALGGQTEIRNDCRERAEDIRGDNLVRALWALRAVATFATTTHVDDEMDTAFGDLLADLHHLADATDLDWYALLSKAEDDHDHEIRHTW